MKALIRSSLFCVIAFLSSSAFADSAQELLSTCRPIAKADVTGDYVKFPQNFETGKCWGTFSVIQSVIVHVDDARRPIYLVCAPSSSRLSQLITIFVAYAEKNPQRLHEESFVIALDSLRASFPCQSRR